MIFCRIEIWVYFIYPPSFSLIGALTIEIYYKADRSGNINTHCKHRLKLILIPSIGLGIIVIKCIYMPLYCKAQSTYTYLQNIQIMQSVMIIIIFLFDKIFFLNLTVAGLIKWFVCGTWVN